MKTKKTSKELRKKTKEKLKKLYGGRKSRIFVHITCNECKREYKIRTNTMEDKQKWETIRETWICLLCDKTI